MSWRISSRRAEVHPSCWSTACGKAQRILFADFVSRVVTGRTINDHLREWAEPRRDQLFAEFAQKAHGKDNKGWLYDGESSKDRPADLGYWIGSEIVSDYYEQGKDKPAALREIIELRDPAKIWRATRYAELFE